MTDILIRQLPAELHRKLKERAQANRRSMNQEIQILLETALADERPIPSAPPPFQGAFPIDDEWLLRAREEGRA